MKITRFKKIEKRPRPGGACDCFSPTPAERPPCCGPENSEGTPASACCPVPTPTAAERPPCCGPAATTRGGVIDERVPGFLRWLTTASGLVPQVATELTWGDHLDACKARWGIGRMNCIVPAGLYAIGTPTEDDPVLVTANYKMSYDLVRQALHGRNIWLLVLETFGVNVWCAAGKGTFGTDEVVAQIIAADLAGIVNHRQLILPILGAPGVAAHEVTKRSGFTIRYGTIRAVDLPAYLDNGMVTTPEMRELTFTLYERLVLLPIEIIHALKSTAVIILGLFLWGFAVGGSATGIKVLIAYLGAIFCGVVIGPLLLPWLPGRSFSVKGAVVGLLWAGLFTALFVDGDSGKIARTMAIFLALAAVSAFYTLNFTGCTTYTSPHGVKKEMRLAIPAMGLALAVSALLLTIDQWF